MLQSECRACKRTCRFDGCGAGVASCCVFFFFKHKTAYELRISDWSSDVCSSDLIAQPIMQSSTAAGSIPERSTAAEMAWAASVGGGVALKAQIGRASCRERVCQYV